MLSRFALAFVAVLAFAPGAAAQEPMGYWFDGNGDPAVDTTAADFVEWRRCPADGSACVGIPSDPSAGDVGYVAAYPGETPPGTVFEAVHVRDGVETTRRTVPWTGRVTMTEPPTITGDAVVGGTIGVRGPDWVGGWAGHPGHAHSVLLACPTPTGGTGCWAVEAKLDARWVGWYLLSQQSYHGLPSGVAEVTGWPVPPYEYREPVDTRTASRFSVFSAPVQVAPVPNLPATPQPMVVKGAEPVVTFRKRVLRSSGTISVGRVTCANPCRVILRVSGGNKKRVVKRFTAAGLRALTVPYRRGRLTVRVYVGGRLLASTRVTSR